MSFSFIVTTYQVSPYIDQCIRSIFASCRDGDEIIIIDDGSDDGTSEKLQELALEAPSFVRYDLVLLAQNTIGGVGIPGNIGLAHATKNFVFFVDGDDFILAENFPYVRAEAERRAADILILNYVELDVITSAISPPADNHKWDNLSNRKNKSPSEVRLAALELIAVPWRKVYRRDFVHQNSLKFPEGDYFFEDNPFHWKVCLLSKSISFLNVEVCAHRVKRDGQTMASNGSELNSFFDHFEVIANLVGNLDNTYKYQALRWLLNNMIWHLDQVSDDALPSYANAAFRALVNVRLEIWNRVLLEFRGEKVSMFGSLLRSGRVDEGIEFIRTRRLIERISVDVDSLSKKIDVVMSLILQLKSDASVDKDLAWLKRRKQSIG